MKILIAWYPGILSMEALEQQLEPRLLEARVQIPEKLRGKSDPTWCELVLEATSVRTAIFYRNLICGTLLQATKGRDNSFSTAVSHFIADDEDQSSVKDLNEMLAVYDNLQAQLGMIVADLKATRNKHPIKEIGDLRRRLEDIARY